MDKKGPLQRFIDKAFFPGLLLASLGFIGFVMLIIKKYLSGELTETYFTGFGVKFSYLGAGILISLIPVIIVIALLLRWWQQREEHDFTGKKKKKKK